MSLLALIEGAFAHRFPPSTVVPLSHPMTDIYSDALAFSGKRWQEITCDQLEHFSAAVYGFSPESFCYFLPGIFSAGIRENRPDLLVNQALINSLDRDPIASQWDNFFLERWPRLTPKECNATQEWLLWMADFSSPVVEDISLTRAYDILSALTLLSQREGEGCIMPKPTIAGSVKLSVSVPENQ